MLQNSRESDAINIDCVDPLGKLNLDFLGATHGDILTIFYSISFCHYGEYPLTSESITKKKDAPYYGWSQMMTYCKYNVHMRRVLHTSQI